MLNKQYKMVEWTSPSGYHYCNCVMDLAGPSAQWWYPARILGLEVDEFVKLLVEKYHAEVKMLNDNFLSYSWGKNDYFYCHNFVLYCNKLARQKNIII